MIEAAEALAVELEASPYAARLGLRAGELMSDIATASVPYLPLLANAQGFVHGGVAASLSIWSAMLVAVASDRDRAASARPLSVSVHYLAAAREEAVFATARVASRGRDLVHVEISVESERGRSVAAALAVIRILAAKPESRPAAATPPAPLEKGLISPFSQSLGLALRAQEDDGASLSMRREGNEGLGGSLDPGALLSLADTCAALACLPSLDERLSGSATLSLSAVFGEPVTGAVVAKGRPVAEDGGLRSALVEVRADTERRTPRLPAMTSCVAYRFLAG